MVKVLHITEIFMDSIFVILVIKNILNVFCLRHNYVHHIGYRYYLYSSPLNFMRTELQKFIIETTSIHSTDN